MTDQEYERVKRAHEASKVRLDRAIARLGVEPTRRSIERQVQTFNFFYFVVCLPAVFFFSRWSMQSLSRGTWLFCGFLVSLSLALIHYAIVDIVWGHNRGGSHD